MSGILNTNISSEIGKLNGVIIHTPGSEVENMIPTNAQQALYSDILNKEIVDKEYDLFSGVLKKVTQTFEVKDLLASALKNEQEKKRLVTAITQKEQLPYLTERLLGMSPMDLAHVLIEGVEMTKDSLTKYLSNSRFDLKPLHNFFFTRDASSSVYNEVLINKMANKVRERESLIMEMIFNHSEQVRGTTVNPDNGEHNPALTIEGGDVLIARDDVLLIGMGDRTTSQGIDFLINHFKNKGKRQHIFVQELPSHPESFIHLDMVFTFLDKDKVMTYDPLIFNSGRHTTYHVEIDRESVKINEIDNLVEGLAKVGMDVKSISNGGNRDRYWQEREQWHSGANFFAFAPGKIIGYSRNVHTIDELSKNGFEVLPAIDVCNGKINPDDYKQCVVTLPGSELPRGGGGCRCMTMPVNRDKVDW